MLFKQTHIFCPFIADCLDPTRKPPRSRDSLNHLDSYYHLDAGQDILSLVSMLALLEGTWDKKSILSIWATKLKLKCSFDFSREGGVSNMLNSIFIKYFSHPWFLQYTRQRFSNCSGTYPAERYWGPSQYCNMNNFACTNLYFCYLPAKWLTESQNSTNPVRVEILPMWSPIPPLYPHLTSKMVSTILSVYISMTPSHCSSREIGRLKHSLFRASCPRKSQCHPEIKPAFSIPWSPARWCCQWSWYPVWWPWPCTGYSEYPLPASGHLQEKM